MKRNEIAKLNSAQAATNRFGIGMLTPTLIVLLVMTAYPLIFTFVYSFTDYNYLKGTENASFVLFDNYVSLFKNGYFQQAVWNTIKFTILAVVLEMALGLLIAVFVNSLKRGQKIMRTLLLLPYLLPAVTVALSWRDDALRQLRHHQPVPEGTGLPVFNWFMDTKTAFGTILLIDVWQNVPFVFLLLYASLQSVSENQYEAARIDGAGFFQQFWYITLPNIKGSLALCALLRTIDTFRLFEKVNVLTGGGPAGTTTTITQFLYTYGIKSLGLRLRQRRRHRDDIAGADPVQLLHQAGHGLSAYGKTEADIRQRGLWGGRPAGMSRPGLPRRHLCHGDRRRQRRSRRVPGQRHRPYPLGPVSLPAGRGPHRPDGSHPCP